MAARQAERGCASPERGVGQNPQDRLGAGTQPAERLLLEVGGMIGAGAPKFR